MSNYATVGTGGAFAPVTEEEALAALTAENRIVSAAQVANAVATARGLGHHSWPGAAKASRALDKLADAGTIIKLDRDNGDFARHMQPGSWNDGRYAWAVPAAAEAARRTQQVHDEAQATSRAVDDRNEDRIAAVLPGAVQVQVYGTTHGHVFTGDQPPVPVVAVKLLLTPDGFEVFAAALEKGTTRAPAAAPRRYTADDVASWPEDRFEIVDGQLYIGGVPAAEHPAVRDAVHDAVAVALESGPATEITLTVTGAAARQLADRLAAASTAADPATEREP